MTISLADLQQKFVSALLIPDETETIAGYFSSPEAKDRFSYYRGNLTAIWNSALKNAYPVLFQLVGAEFFEQMAKTYGRAYPSQSGDLNELGGQLPQFLIDSGITKDYPYFYDLAVLEWQLHKAYYAADDPILTLPSFVSAMEQKGLALSEAGLSMHAAVSLHQSDWATVDIWTVHQGSDTPSFDGSLKKACFGVVTRPDWLVSFTALEEPAYIALRALQDGRSLGDALETVLQHDPDFSIGSHLSQWFTLGIFSSIKTE